MYSSFVFKLIKVFTFFNVKPSKKFSGASVVVGQTITNPSSGPSFDFDFDVWP